MAKKEKKVDAVRTEGVILEALPNTTFKIKLDSGHELLAYVSGKMRMNYIRILPRRPGCARDHSLRSDTCPYRLPQISCTTDGFPRLETSRRF